MTKSFKPFLNKDFLLTNDAAVQLYEQYAASMPIIDYHNHLSPKEIAENRKFNNITEPWLAGDHYKWRAMRTNGVAEKYCTGNASPFDKFNEWAKTVPYTMRNPLYHWTHLELKSYFGITKILDESSARDIYDQSSAMLQQEDFRVQGLLAKMNVQVVCTTDDPIDSLEYHQQFAKQGTALKMYPSFRPDKAYATENPVAYNEYLEKLAGASNTSINSFDDLISALVNRIKFFNSLGCRASDHGLEFIHFDANALSKSPELFKKVRGGKELSTEERLQLRCAILIHLCKEYHSIGWAQQLHLGALRNNSARMIKQLGPDTGFDSVGDFSQAQHLSRFLDYLDTSNQLAKTVIYNLNPSDNEVFATMVGNFNDGSMPGKMQFGSGWWFLDQKDGMERQMNTLSNMGLLSRFVGMVTDSRSFLSFPRHEYFRRTLCNLVGKDVENGELPNDIPRIGKMIEDICYNNVKTYFKF
ncbi:MAG: glucuronate isomerase [Cyclobacteriaceae bacterium]|nr:glucuronate isomerase [Cyclobacteriaceae bacterium]